MQFIPSMFSWKWLCGLLTLLPCLSPAALQVTLQPQQMTYLGYSIVMSVAEPQDDGTLRCQWLKDGRVIPGQTGHLLEIPQARFEDAGYYQARIIRADGAVGTSQKTPLVVVDSQDEKLVYISSHSMILQPGFRGPVDRIFWVGQERYRQPSPLKDIWWIRGTQTSRLRILSSYMLPESLDCMAMVGGVEYLLGSFRFDYNPELAPFMQPRFHAAPWDINATVGSEIEQPNYYIDNGILEISGLPPGVTSSDGSLVGTPTKAGNYHLRWKLLNAKGQVTDTTRSWVFVKDPEKPAPYITPGLWSGEVVGTLEEAPIKSLSKGLVEVQASVPGVFSGLLRLGPHRWPMAGALRWDGELFKSRVVLAPPAGVRRLVCILSAFPDDSGLAVSFEIEFAHPDKLQEGAADWGLVGFLWPPCTPDSADVLRPAGLGRITALLKGDETEDGHALGHGYMSMIPSAGLQRLNVTGTLPDGSGITGSMPVVSGQPFSVIFYSPLRLAGESLSGKLEMIGFPWFLDDRPVLLDLLYWQRQPVQGRGWLAGKPRELVLDVQGEVYFQPDAGPLLPSTLPGTEAFIRLDGGSAFADFISPESIPFDLKPDHRAVFPKPDPRSFKLDIYTPTGFFTGSFKLLDVGGGGAQKVTFKGMMAPGLSRGAGYFHFRAPMSMGGDPSAFYSGTLDVFRPDDELVFGPPAFPKQTKHSASTSASR